MNAIDVLHYGHRQLTETLDRLSGDDWARIALGVWTTKDLVGHLAAFETRFADVLATFAGEPATSGLIGADPATFNDAQAAIRRDWSVDAVLAELHASHERASALARRLPPALWSEVGTIPWYGSEYALDDLVVYTIYGHKREHIPQLDAVLERGQG